MDVRRVGSKKRVPVLSGVREFSQLRNLGVAETEISEDGAALLAGALDE